MQKAHVDDPFSIEITSTNATGCTEATLGNVPLTGYINEVAQSGGRHEYVVTCTGPGGAASATATVVVPMPVGLSSYENKSVDVAPAPLPLFPTRKTGAFQRFSGGRGYADFEQAGQYNWFLTPFTWGEDDPWSRSPIHIFRNENDEWVDISAEILEPDPETGELPDACMSVRRSLIADFNGDKVPDVFLSCATDAPPNEPFADHRREMPYILLSQPNGKLRLETVLLERPVYSYGATAGDINGDGYTDVVITDQLAAPGEQTVIVLYNNTDGTFTGDYSQFPTLTMWEHTPWVAELVTIEGEQFLWLAGADEDAVDFNGLTHGLWAIENGRFNPHPVRKLPPAPGNYVGCDTCYMGPADIVVDGSVLYVLRTGALGYAIQRIDLETDEASIVFEYTGPDYSEKALENPACYGFWGTTIDGIRAYRGKIVTEYECTSPNFEMF